MWYGDNEDLGDVEDEDDEEDDEGDDEEDVPLLESGVIEAESDRPTVLETFILAVDESLSLLLHWSAKNWKLDGDFVESEKEDEDEEGQQPLDLESHVGSHALPLLKVVRKYLKKVERTLKGIQNAVQGMNERKLEEALGAMRTFVLEGRDQLSFKYSRQRFKHQQDVKNLSEEFEGKHGRLMNLRRQKMIEETLSALFWWWKVGVLLGGALSLGGSIGLCCVWLLGGYGSLAELWVRVKHSIGRTWAVMLSIKLPSWIVPDQPRSLWKTIVICALAFSLFSTPFFILCAWKLFDLFIKLTNESDIEDLDNRHHPTLNLNQNQHLPSTATTTTHLGHHPQVLIHSQSLHLPRTIPSSSSSSSSSLVSPSQTFPPSTTVSSPLKSPSGYSAPPLLGPIAPDPSSDGEEAEMEHCEKFPAEEFMQNAIAMWEGMGMATDWLLKSLGEQGTGVVLKELWDTSRGDRKSIFEANMATSLRHCASLILSYADLQEAIAYKQEQKRLKKIYSNPAIYQMEDYSFGVGLPDDGGGGGGYGGVEYYEEGSDSEDEYGRRGRGDGSNNFSGGEDYSESEEEEDEDDWKRLSYSEIEEDVLSIVSPQGID